MRVAKILELFFSSKFVLGQMNLLNITLNVKTKHGQGLFKSIYKYTKKIKTVVLK